VQRYRGGEKNKRVVNATPTKSEYLENVPRPRSIRSLN